MRVVHVTGNTPALAHAGEDRPDIGRLFAQDNWRCVPPDTQADMARLWLAGRSFSCLHRRFDECIEKLTKPGHASISRRAAFPGAA